MLTTDDKKYLDAVREVLVPEHKAVFDYLYECLSIIDGKAASLLQFNSIIIAAMTVLMVLLTQQRAHLESWLSAIVILTALTLAMMLLSSAILLLAVWIYWAPTKDIKGARYIDELLQRRTHRTLIYKVAWLMSFSSLPLFMVDLSLIYFRYIVH